MEYVARISREGRFTLVEFPDCPGCQTFFDPREDTGLGEVARDALEGWLVAHLERGDAPSVPVNRSRGAHSLSVRIAPSLSIALQIRWRRQELGLSQAQLGKRLGVSRQQVATLENPDSNLRLTTLEAAARALDVDLGIELLPRAREAAAHLPRRKLAG
jgi:DNA-binding XRE family transcriptional regulator